MTTRSIATALTFGFLTLTLSVLPATTVSAQPSVDQTRPDIVCESKGNRWDPQRGRCIKTLKKTKPPGTSGGVGGGCPPGYSEYQGRCALYQDGKIIFF
jgi:hypothetical protein